MISDDSDDCKGLIHEQYNQQSGKYESSLTLRSQAPIGHEMLCNKNNSKSVQNLVADQHESPSSSSSSSKANSNQLSNVDFYINNNGPYSLPILPQSSYFRATHPVERPVESMDTFDNSYISLMDPSWIGDNGASM